MCGHLILSTEASQYLTRRRIKMITREERIKAYTDYEKTVGLERLIEFQVDKEIFMKKRLDALKDELEKRDADVSQIYKVHAV